MKSITYNTKISKGMWAIRECVQWTLPMFEITDEFISTVVDLDDDVCTIGDENYVKIRGEDPFLAKSYLFADTKDELKTKILGFLYGTRDGLENKIQDIRGEIDWVNNLIGKVAGA